MKGFETIRALMDGKCIQLTECMADKDNRCVYRLQEDGLYVYHREWKAWILAWNSPMFLLMREDFRISDAEIPEDAPVFLTQKSLMEHLRMNGSSVIGR